MLEKRMQEIAERKEEIKVLLRSEEVVSAEQIAEIEQEIDVLDAEVAQLEEQRSATAKLNEKLDSKEVRSLDKPQTKEITKTMEFENMTKQEVRATSEYRSAYFKALKGEKISETEQRALTTASGSAGAAVPTTTENQIINKLRQTSALFPYISVTNIAGNVSLVVANAKTAANWKTEGADGSVGDDTVATVSLTGYEAIKLAQISAAAQAMTIDALETYIVDEISRQIAIMIENAVLKGDGTGEPTGIDTLTWTDGSNAVAYTTAIAYADVLELIAALPTMYHQNAKFVMNRKAFWTGIQNIKSTTGEPIFVYNAQDGLAGTIFGYPVIISDFVDDGDIFFGDFSYYRFNFSAPIAIESSRESAFNSGKITYRGLVVADGKPALAEAFVKAYLA